MCLVRNLAIVCFLVTNEAARAGVPAVPSAFCTGFHEFSHPEVVCMCTNTHSRRHLHKAHERPQNNRVRASSGAHLRSTWLRRRVRKKPLTCQVRVDWYLARYVRHLVFKLANYMMKSMFTSSYVSTFWQPASSTTPSCGASAVSSLLCCLSPGGRFTGRGVSRLRWRLVAWPRPRVMNFPQTLNTEGMSSVFPTRSPVTSQLVPYAQDLGLASAVA